MRRSAGHGKAARVSPSVSTGTGSDMLRDDPRAGHGRISAQPKLAGLIGLVMASCSSGKPLMLNLASISARSLGGRR